MHRGQRAVRILTGLVSTAALGLVVHGAAFGATTTWRLGIAGIVIGTGAFLAYRMERCTDRLIETQTKLTAVADSERQRFAQLGYRAGRLDDHVDDASIIPMPQPRPAQRRHRGGA